MVHDGAHGLNVQCYYVKPRAQVEQLSDLGYRNVKVYSLRDGTEVEDRLDEITDPWLYYLCEVKK